MRRIVALLLALLMTLTMTTLSWAEGESAVGATGPTSGTCGAESNVGGRDSVKWEVTPNGGKVASEDKDGNTVLLPAYTLTISGKGDIMDEPGGSKAGCWAALDKNGKMYGDQITQVIIEEGVTGIGAVALNRNLHKTTISIPASVTKIGKRAFGSEMVVTLAEGNTAFKMVDNVLFTSDMKTLVRYFPGEGTADSYTVPATVETILGGAFQKAKINHIDLGSVKFIGDYAFQETVIPEIVLPESVTEIESQLVNHAKVQKLVIGNGLTTIPNAFCENNEYLEEVVIGKGVKTIGNRAFAGCKFLRTVTFAEGNTLTDFGNRKGTVQILAWCPKLESIELPDSCTFVAYPSFQNCSNLRTIVARGIETWEDFNHPMSDVGYYKATVGFSDALRGNYSSTTNGIGMAKYAVNGVQAKTLGWYTAEGICVGNEQYKDDTSHISKFENNPTTVYAVYMTDCAMDANGGTGTMDSVHSYVAPGLGDGVIKKIDKEWKDKKTYNENTKAPACTFTAPTGYVFMGWNTEADGSGVSYNVDDYLKTTNQPLTKRMTARCTPFPATPR